MGENPPPPGKGPSPGSPPEDFFEPQKPSFLQKFEKINLPSFQSCSFSAFIRPFRFRVDFDNLEDNVKANDGSAKDVEQAIFPGGIIGFDLIYKQFACT